MYRTFSRSNTGVDPSLSSRRFQPPHHNRYRTSTYGGRNGGYGGRYGGYGGYGGRYGGRYGGYGGRYGGRRRRRHLSFLEYLANLYSTNARASDEDESEEETSTVDDTVSVDIPAVPAPVTDSAQPENDSTVTAPAADDAANKPKIRVRVEGIDLHETENRLAHHTNDYEIEKEEEDEAEEEVAEDPKKDEDTHLVLRRGQSFSVTLTLNRPYRPKDKIIIKFATGNDVPMISKDTLVKVPYVKSLTPEDWGVVVKSSEGKTVTLDIMIAPEAIVGRYRMTFETLLKENKTRKHLRNIYILFNAWCKEDTVYMEGDLEKEEYVLNDSGFIWNEVDAYRSRGRNWDFAQFDLECFQVALDLLENSDLKTEYHSDPVRVCRALSAMVNSADIEGGVLEGNWSGNYEGGTSPLSWNSSHAILEEYFGEGKPVKYGQCWVFSAVLTTVARALGIPTRSVTNFSSAHDTDENCTIDSYFDADGNRLKRNDSVWNFHVWNEAWMQRPDLPEGNDGWQAFDATPQERSERKFQCGPAPLNALKRGDVNVSYDAKFIFAEVNGDSISWRQDKRDHSIVEIISISTDAVGEYISTKSIIGKTREDITNQYKHKEGSEEAKNSMKNALSHVRRAMTKPDKKRYLKMIDMIEKFKEIVRVQDVKFTFGDSGQNTGDVTFSVAVENTSSDTRNVRVKLQIVGANYTGNESDDLIAKELEFKLAANEKKEESFILEAKDWMNTVAEDETVVAYFYGKVKETEQEEQQRRSVKLDKPDIEMEVSPSSVKANEKVNVTLKFTNPLKIPLRKIVMKLDGASIKSKKIVIGEPLAPGATLVKTLEVTPRHAYEDRKVRELLCSLNSRQLSGIQGVAKLEVTAATESTENAPTGSAS